MQGHLIQSELVTLYHSLFYLNIFLDADNRYATILVFDCISLRIVLYHSSSIFWAI